MKVILLSRMIHRRDSKPKSVLKELVACIKRNTHPESLENLITIIHSLLCPTHGNGIAKDW